MATGQRYNPEKRKFTGPKAKGGNLPDRLQPNADNSAVSGAWTNLRHMTEHEQSNKEAASAAAIPSESMPANPVGLDIDPNRYDGDSQMLRIGDGSDKGTVYYPRRILPPGGTRPLLTEHTVQEGDRLDLIAYQYYGDPLLYWEIADANNAMQPEELLRVGNRLLIPNLS